MLLRRFLLFSEVSRNFVFHLANDLDRVRLQNHGRLVRLCVLGLRAQKQVRLNIHRTIIERKGAKHITLKKAGLTPTSAIRIRMRKIKSPIFGLSAVHGCHTARAIWLCACVRWRPHHDDGPSVCSPCDSFSYLHASSFIKTFFLQEKHFDLDRRILNAQHCYRHLREYTKYSRRLAGVLVCHKNPSLGICVWSCPWSLSTFLTILWISWRRNTEQGDFRFHFSERKLGSASHLSALIPFLLRPISFRRKSSEMFRIDTSLLLFPSFFNILVSFYPKLFFLFTCKNGKTQDTKSQKKIVNYYYVIINFIIIIWLLIYSPGNVYSLI